MILKITRAMMNYDVRDSSTHETTKLDALIHDCLAICGFRLKGVEVQLELDENCAVRVHRTHVAQVISNLISNAVDAMLPESTQAVRAPVLKVSSKVEKHNGHEGVVVAVEDNGQGVPDDLVQDIFKPFFTTKGVGKGTGIGLAVSKRIVDDHKGVIGVQPSTSLGGACFRVWLPRLVHDLGERA